MHNTNEDKTWVWFNTMRYKHNVDNKIHVKLTGFILSSHVLKALFPNLCSPSSIFVSSINLDNCSSKANNLSII